jgi:hypothetical protein
VHYGPDLPILAALQGREHETVSTQSAPAFRRRIGATPKADCTVSKAY